MYSSFVLKVISLIQILFLCAMTLAPASHGQGREGQKLKYPKLTKDGFAQLKSFYTAVIEECPPPKCLQVYIGRSNILAAAYGTSIGHGDSIVNLPLSGVKSIPEADWTKASTNFGNWVLDPILGPRIGSEVERIVVIDYLNSGESIGLSVKFVREWMEQHELNGLDMKLLVYGRLISDRSKRLLSELGVEPIRLSFSIGFGQEGDYANIVRESKAGGYAPYGAWEPHRAIRAPGIDPGLRRPYPFIDDTGATAYASYNDLIEWMKNPSLDSNCSDPWKHFVN